MSKFNHKFSLSLLQTKNFREVENIEVAIAQYFLRVIEEVGLSSVLQIVIDNATNCKAAGRGIQKAENKGRPHYGLEPGIFFNHMTWPPRKRHQPVGPAPPLNGTDHATEFTAAASRVIHGLGLCTTDKTPNRTNLPTSHFTLYI
ncbi:uncharacterized protein LOC130713800 [Lotus japonicus]|uniref:uncharacterized protein LOC130713800 n=1 Tax=Lotus japonicus TaxID=34305 RepID=UPI00258F46C6|nr:uncharacterized protein LOC130713800 [Lotus japonicus]